MKLDFIQELVQAAEWYYDSSEDLHRIEDHARAVDRDGGDMHQIVDAQASLASQKGETLRAAGALLRAAGALLRVVEAYRADLEDPQ